MVGETSANVVFVHLLTDGSVGFLRFRRGGILASPVFQLLRQLCLVRRMNRTCDLPDDYRLRPFPIEWRRLIHLALAEKVPLWPFAPSLCARVFIAFKHGDDVAILGEVRKGNLKRTARHFVRLQKDKTGVLQIDHDW